VAAGLALYFIIGAVWSLIERQFIPKATDPKPGTAGATAELSPRGGSPNGQATPAKPPGMLGRLREAMQKKMEEMQKKADEQSRRQIRNAPGQKPGPGQQPPRRDDNRDKKKKRRR
jgi:hypothetical protein